MHDLSLEERITLADAQRKYMALLMLDQVWSSMTTRTLTPRELERAPEIAENLGALIEECVLSAQRVTGIVESHVVAYRRDGEEVLDRIASNIGQGVIEVLGGHDFDLLRMSREASAGLADTQIPARDALVQELNELLAEVQKGDDPALLPSVFMCNFADCMMVAGALATWIPPHVQGPAAVAAGVAISRAIKCHK